MLSRLISTGDWRQVLVFTRTKHGANRLAEQLGKDGLTAAAIHGNKSQGARTRALAGFKNGEVRILVATDIAARGARHRPAALRRQLRAAERAGGLRAPHRAHGAGGAVGTGGVAGLRRRAEAAARHRAADPTRSAEGGRRGFRGRSVDSGRAHRQRPRSGAPAGAPAGTRSGERSWRCRRGPRTGASAGLPRRGRAAGARSIVVAGQGASRRTIAAALTRTAVPTEEPDRVPRTMPDARAVAVPAIEGTGRTVAASRQRRVRIT